jgi:hypothetical protein
MVKQKTKQVVKASKKSYLPATIAVVLIIATLGVSFYVLDPFSMRPSNQVIVDSEKPIVITVLDRNSNSEMNVSRYALYEYNWTNDTEAEFTTKQFLVDSYTLVNETEGNILLSEEELIWNINCSYFIYIEAESYQNKSTFLLMPIFDVILTQIPNLVVLTPTVFNVNSSANISSFEITASPLVFNAEEGEGLSIMNKGGLEATIYNETIDQLDLYMIFSFQFDFGAYFDEFTFNVSIGSDNEDDRLIHVESETESYLIIKLTQSIYDQRAFTIEMNSTMLQFMQGLGSMRFGYAHDAVTSYNQIDIVTLGQFNFPQFGN